MTEHDCNLTRYINLFSYYLQHPRIFSGGMFRKNGPPRKAVSIL